MSRKFTYKFQDGTEVESEQIGSVLLDYLELKHGDCVYNGWAEFMGVGKPSLIGIVGGANGKGFKTGWNPALGIEIKSPSHYKQVLKDNGLREVGNETQKSAPIKKSYVTEEVIKEAVDAGAEISGQEAAALVAGESLSDN